MQTAYFNRFSVELPDDCVTDCGHQGQCDEDVSFWANKLQCPIEPAKLAAELKEYGAWDSEELSDHEANWRRIIWVSACDIREGNRKRAGH